MTSSVSPSLDRLSREIAVLSVTEKLWLLAQIAQQVQPDFSEDLAVRGSFSELDLLEMANDPDIQREMTAIDSEFAVALMDGLEG
jgi:hypothetical protein